MNRKSDYKDIKKWRSACHRQRLKYYGKTADSENSHKRWTDEEIEIIMRHEVPDHVISAAIGRSVESIQIKRCNENKKRLIERSVDLSQREECSQKQL